MQFRACIAGIGLLALGSAAYAEPAGLAAPDVLAKTLEAYNGAKTYQSTWTFTKSGDKGAFRATMEIKSKGPTRVYFRVAPEPAKPGVPPATESIPEMLVVLDGKTAWFQQSAEKVYFKVTLPKNTAGSPLMFIPQITAVNAPRRSKDIEDGGKWYYVIYADMENGGISRLEIESQTFHIRSIESETANALGKTTATIKIDKEKFDADVTDKDFTYKPPKGFKEIDAPMGAEVMFAPPSPPTSADGKDTAPAPDKDKDPVPDKK